MHSLSSNSQQLMQLPKKRSQGSVTLKNASITDILIHAEKTGLTPNSQEMCVVKCSQAEMMFARCYCKDTVVFGSRLLVLLTFYEK